MSCVSLKVVRALATPSDSNFKSAIYNATKHMVLQLNHHTNKYVQNKQCDEDKIGSARHTVPNIGRHKGPAAIQHEDQELLSRKKAKSTNRCEATAGHIYIYCVNACFQDTLCLSADLQRSLTTAAFTFSSSSRVQFTICRWKNVDVELPNVNACS